MNISLSTNDQKLILQALSMDLLRAALMRHRGSHVTADRFIAEAQSHLAELGTIPFSVPIKKALKDRSDRQADDLLMYSTIIKNRALSL